MAYYTIGTETHNGQSRQTTQRTEKTEAAAETSSCNSRIKIPLHFGSAEWHSDKSIGSRRTARRSSALIHGDQHFDTGARLLLAGDQPFVYVAVVSLVLQP
jgi:hypothetical protein